MMNGNSLPKNSISSGIESLASLIKGFPVGDNAVWE